MSNNLQALNLLTEQANPKMSTNQGTDLLGSFRRKLAQSRRLRALAERDPSTGLLRRSSFFERLSPWVLQPNQPFTLCLIELEQVQAIYRSYGSSIVEQILGVIGGVLASSFGMADVRGRYGAAAFSVALPGVVATQCAAAVRGVLSAIAELVFVDQEERDLSISCIAGVADFPFDGQTIEGLCKVAERKLWLAARRGAGEVVL